VIYYRNSGSGKGEAMSSKIDAKDIARDASPGSWWMVKKGIVFEFGMSAALWLAEIISKRDYLIDRLMLDKDEWFYYSQQELERKTGLSSDVQTKIIGKLIDGGILQVVKKGLPARNHYKINWSVYISITGQDFPHDSPVPAKFYQSPLNTGTGSRSERAYNNKDINKKDSLLPPSEEGRDKEPLHGSLFADPFDPYSNKAKQVCLLWNDKYSDVLPKHNVAKTKSFDATMQKIEIALTHYSLDQIDEAMDCYHTLLCMDDLKLNPKIGSHRVGLGDFFGFGEYAKKAIRPNNVVYGIESWFDECLNGIEYLIGKYCIGGVEDEYPEVSAIIKKRWIESPYYIGSLTTWDKNNFKRAAIKLVTWLQKHENKYNLDSLYVDDPKKAVGKYLFPALNNDLGHRDPKMVTTNWLASDSMFERTLHLYLKKLGL
jgi:hypothetical protein